MTADEPLPDIRGVVCNFTEGTSAVAAGAKAYIVGAFGGNLPDGIEVAVRSRGGRWIRKWERIRRLDNFRWATIPPQHRCYGEVARWRESEDLVETLRKCRREVLSEPRGQA